MNNKFRNFTLQSLPLGLLTSALISLNACAGEDTNAAQNTQIPIAAPIPNAQTISPTHLKIFDIFAAGEIASRTQNPKDLVHAAQSLNQIGARSLNGSNNFSNMWLATARTLQPTQELPALPYRGRVKGPAYRKNILGAGETEILEEVYYASEKAELSLKSEGGLQLGLSIAEQIPESENIAAPVCVKSTGVKPANCQWLPLWTAKYTITISNHAQNPISYVLVTN